MNLEDALKSKGVSPGKVRVLIEIAQGKTKAEIAKELGLSPRAVQRYVCEAFKIMNIKSRHAFVLWASAFQETRTS